MTVMAWCLQCTFHFATHTEQPVVPAHLVPGTAQMCAGSGALGTTGVS